MRNTLLTTTALVLSAGIASADGHASISWSGTATAGVARQGEVKAVATKLTASMLLDMQAEYADIAAVLITAGAGTNDLGRTAHGTAAGATTGTTEVAIKLSIANSKAAIAANTVAKLGNKSLNDAIVVRYDAILAMMTAANSGTVAAVKAGDFESYSEVNATVTGSVTAGDTTMTAAMSVDAGKGYTFASDKTFDTAKTNGVSLDNITIASAMGTFKIDENAVAHLVDGDDDGNADLLYTNTFGSISFSAAIDVSKDTDDKAVKAVAAVVTDANTGTAAKFATTGTSSAITTAAVTAVAADVSWSAKVSMPVGTGTAYVAMDEEGGNIFGASTTLGGVGISFSSKLEALEEEISADRVNDIGLTYVMGATTMKATWNSVEDKDQWGISAAYAADGMTISASTDEGSDWSVSGSYLMGTGASVVGGVNYTEDAYLGLSFSF